MTSASESVPALELGPGEARGFIGRLLRQPVAVVCVLFLALVVAVAVFAPVLLPDVATEPAGDLAATLKGPSLEHPLGTDSLGRDVLDRLLVGTRVTIVGVVLALVTALALGIPAGLAAGYFGGRTDRVVGWVADLAFSMPAIIIVLVVLSVFPQSMTAAMITLGLLLAPGLMRVVRSTVLPVKEELYVAAARVSGLSQPYIVARHILPRVQGTIIVQASLAAAVALLVQTGLAFLGLVVAAPAPSWGGMVADGVAAIAQQPWLIWPPGLAIAVTILALGLLGDSVRDVSAERWNAPVRAARRRSVSPRVVAEPRASDPDEMLALRDVTVVFPSPSGGTTTVVDDVGFSIGVGETVGLVGESGCGKTMTAMAILGQLPPSGFVESGEIIFQGRDLAPLGERDLRCIRGRSIGFVSQEPMIGLNPGYRIGWQLAEVIRRHHGGSMRAARARSVELLAQVELSDPGSVARRYPHELSGGMAQRVAIARALAGDPSLLIADEPTTALDVTVQAEILELLRGLQAERQMSILLVTHDWGVAVETCSRIVVMYAGQVVELGHSVQLLRDPQHPYTKALLASNPQLDAQRGQLPTIPGSVPAPGAWPPGCRFEPRCRLASEACRVQPVSIRHLADGREARCVLVEGTEDT